jgi:hypothetical protein
MTQTNDSSVTVVTAEHSGEQTGGYGILRFRDDVFPARGQWGSPTRIHPSTANAKVEVYRLGRDLSHYPSELPQAFEKYVVFWAMSKALEREGSGQQIELADHYRQRFEIGIKRIEKKKRDMQSERIGRLGSAQPVVDFGIGLPRAPYPYGEPF